MEALKLDCHRDDGSIAILTFNRPDALNAMNTRMIKELLELFREQAYNAAFAAWFSPAQAPVVLDRR